MPTYEYRCSNGHDFEEFFLKMSAAKSELPCPTCGGRGERRMSAGGGLVFKGSGFYITDYGKDGKKAANAARAGASSTESGGGESAKADTPKSDGSKADAAKTESSAASGSKSESKSESKSTSEPKGSSASTAPKPKGKE